MQFLAALILIAVWSTTALAINWSVQGLAYPAALFGRFSLAAVVALALMFALYRKRLPGGAAWRAYLTAGLGTSLSMLCTYWASRHVSSGLVAVLFGLIPLSTALFARLWLDEKLARHELVGIGLGVAGLVVVFGERLSLAPDGLPALLVLLLAVALQSGAAVRLKPYGQGLPALAVNAGALLVCAVVTGMLWLAHGAPPPWEAPPRTLGAVVYLALVGSVLAFSLYYWLIRECRPGQVAVLSLLSPASALWLGHALNDETVTGRMMAGTALILAGLVLHQRHTLRHWRG
ncbi:DMT family transporter [Chitiniphilus eburneus]|nr:EamA family transporter [Chitiniphilus eburneus]